MIAWRRPVRWALLAMAGFWITALAGTIDLKFNPPDVDLPGVSAGDHTGQTVLVADYDGDGREDLVIGAPDHDYAGRSNCGVVFVVLASDTLTSPVDLADVRPDLKRIFGPLASSKLGTVLACGDVDGDGRDDIACGTPTAGPNGRAQSGEVWIVYGSETPQDTIDLASPAGAASRIQGAAAFDKLGTSIAVGPVDGDVYGDLLIGAPLASSPGLSFSGMAYIIYGAQNPDAVIDLASTAWPLVEIYAESNSDFLGNACGLADVNNDTYADLVIGAPQAEPFGRSAAGITYVIPGGPSLSTPIDLATLPTGVTRIAGTTNSLLGSHLAAGHLAGDGNPDLVIAAPEFSPPGRNAAGAVYVIEHTPGWSDTIDLAAGPTGTSRIDGPVAGLKIGSALAVGDMNNDGFGELAIGIPNLTHTARNGAGQVSVLFGHVAWPANIDLATEQPGLTTFRGNNANDNTGSAVAFGYFDADLKADLAIGAKGSAVSGQVGTGRAMVIYGDPSITPTSVLYYEAFFRDHGVHVEWMLLDTRSPEDFEVTRSTGDIARQLHAPIQRIAGSTYAFEDPNVVPGRSYTYTVATKSPDGQILFSLTVRVPNARTAALHPAFPNPFTTATTIEVDVPQSGRARVRVYDVQGKLVAELADGPLDAGTTALTWDGRTRTGAPAAPGIYFVQLRFDNQRLTRKLVLVR